MISQDERIESFGDRSMSYVAAFRCLDGIVMCADTQETIGEYKDYVEKIEIIKENAYPLAVAGAGLGDIVDCCTQEIIERAEATKPKTIPELRRMVADCLKEVFENDIPALGITKQPKACQLLIAAKPPEDVDCIIVTKGRRVHRETLTKGIIGFPSPYNKALLNRLYRNDLPLSHGVVIAAYLVSQSKQFDDGVGGGTSIAIVKGSQVCLDDPEWIRNLEIKAAEVIPLVDDLFMACADVGLSAKQFDDRLRAFITNARQLRQRHIDFATEYTIRRGLENINDAYPKFPVGGFIQVQGDTNDPGSYAGADSEDKFLKPKPSVSEKSKPEP